MANFDEIVMVMHICHFNPMGNQKICKFENPRLWTATILTSISANASGPHDAASCKIYHIALPTEYNYQETSVGR